MYSQDYINCTDKINNYIENGIYDDYIKNCIDTNLISNYSSQPNANIVHNPINHNELCKLINSKKTEKYIHTYSVDKFVNSLKELQNNSCFEDYLDIFIRTIDTNIYTNCCNCISIVLYTYYNAETLLNRYMKNIYLSVINIEKYLPNWVVRIYFDSSVYLLINNPNNENKNVIDELKKIYNYISNSPNAEIYTYLCKSLSNISNDDIYYKSRTRMTRFLPFIDKTVKTSIVREADGTVTAVDCHNIRLFEKTSKLFYNISNLINNDYYEKYSPVSYSYWLTYFKLVIDREYFKKKGNLFDILAGMIGINFKIKNDIFENIYHNTTNMINKAVDDYNGSYVRNLIVSESNKYNGELKNKVLNFSYKFDTYKDNIAEYLNMGFDEIFLLNLFKDLISCPIYDNVYDENYLDDVYDKDYLDIIKYTILDCPKDAYINLNFKFKLKIYNNVSGELQPLTRRNLDGSISEINLQNFSFFSLDSYINDNDINPYIKIDIISENNSEVDNIIKKYANNITYTFIYNYNIKEQFDTLLSIYLFIIDYCLEKYYSGSPYMLAYSVFFNYTEFISDSRVENIYSNASLMNFSLGSENIIDTLIDMNFINDNMNGGNRYLKKYMINKNKYMQRNFLH